MEQTAKIETLTPSECADMLANCNSYNRPLNEKRARMMAAAIAAGEWRLNGETIVIADNGHIMTGQHRMRACVLAKKPIQSWVVRGVPAEYFSTCDGGSKKTNGDILKLSGETNSNALSSVARWVAIIKNDGKVDTFLTPTQTIAVLDETPAIRVWVARLMSFKGPSRSVCTAPMLAAIVMASIRYGESAVKPFFDGLVTGANIAQKSPAYMLRERMLAQGYHTKLSPLMRCVLTIKALHAHIRGKESIAMLRWKADEQFPTL